MGVEFTLCLSIAAITILAIVAPLVFGAAGKLQSASRIDDPSTLKEMMTGLVESFVKEEADFEKGHISKSHWKARSQFLLNRYIDASHQMARLDLMGPRGDASKYSAVDIAGTKQ